MPSDIVTTTFGDLRLVVPHGLEPPCDPPPPGPGPHPPGPPPIIPSYETDTEDWADQEMGKGGGGGIPQGGIKGVKGPKGPPPKERPKEKPPEGEKGEEGEEEEEKEEKEGTGDKLVDDLIDKYTKSHSADSDQLRDQMINPETEGSGGDTGTKMPWPESIPRPTKDEVNVFWDKMERKRREYQRDPRTRDHSQDPGHDPTIRPPGIGVGGELFQNLGIKPMKTGLWKEAVRNWFKSLPMPIYESKWQKEDIRLQSPMRQLAKLTGGTVRLPARRVKSPKSTVAKVLVLVDVSGSVFARNVQEDFASILMSVPRDVADIDIFTFDHGGQEGPFKPKTYNPKFGGGGTEPWGFIANLMATPKYSNRAIDGYMMLTDGAFANPPPDLITKPKKWCFVMTSQHTADSVPKDAKIIRTFVDDPEWQKHMREAKSTDVMREVVIKK